MDVSGFNGRSRFIQNEPVSLQTLLDTINIGKKKTKAKAEELLRRLCVSGSGASFKSLKGSTNEYDDK